MKPTISSWFLSVPVYLDRGKVNPCLKNYLFCDHDMPDLNCKIMQPPPKNGHVLAENQNRFVAAELQSQGAILFMEKYIACFKFS